MSRGFIPPFSSSFARVAAMGAVLLWHAVAAATPCSDDVSPAPVLTSTACVAWLVDALVERSFPELRGVPIDIETFRSRRVFFRSRPRTLGAASARPRFVVGVNPVVFSRKLPIEAAEAILAHELAHTVRYVQEGLPGMLDTLWGRIDMRHTPKVEKGPDLDAIARGYGPGLVVYRQHLYGWLNDRDRARKQRNYLTPDEIVAAMAELGSRPALVDAAR